MSTSDRLDRLEVNRAEMKDTQKELNAKLAQNSALIFNFAATVVVLSKEIVQPLLEGHSSTEAREGGVGASVTLRTAAPVYDQAHGGTTVMLFVCRWRSDWVDS